MVLVMQEDKKLNDFKGICIKKSLKEELDKLKIVKSESYNEVIERLIKYKTWYVKDNMLIFDTNDKNICISNF